MENAPAGTTLALATALDGLRFNDQGLIPSITQDADSGAVLMMAWMDRTAIERTLEDGYAWYYSRSRQAYWRKGETSGHTQKLVTLHADCDGDTLLLQVEQVGHACHTYRPSCFYIELDSTLATVRSDPGTGD
ncbi:MAG: phosphoribosyl-AMP cyclohydrolase [Pseudomonadota bacterium]